MSPSIELKALQPALIIQCLLAIIVVIIAGATIPQNRAELVRYRNKEIDGKHIYAPFIKNLGPENYPLLFTVLMLSLFTVCASLFGSVLPRFRTGLAATLSQFFATWALTATSIVGLISFASLSGPPAKAWCGVGSNLLDVGHNLCAPPAIEWVWFILSLFLTVATWTVIILTVLSRRRTRNAATNIIRVRKLETEGGNVGI